MNADPSSGNAVRLTIAAMASAASTPMKYTENITAPWYASGKSAAMISVYTGRRAPQLISGAMNWVMSRSRRDSIVRVAMMAGTVQPKPTSRGMKLLPCSPTVRMARSMMNAARAM